MSGFQSPNWTECPNDLFDDYMSIMGDAELRVVLAIIRQTRGWHQTSAKYSIKNIKDITGLSRNGVIAGARQAEQRGLIKRINPNDIKSAEWELVINETPSLADPSASEPPQPLRVNPSATEGLKSQTPSATEGQLRLKKDIKERERNDFDLLREAQSITGLLALANDMPTLVKWEQGGVIPDDIRAALAWRAENNKPPVKAISQLSGGVEVSRLQRIQRNGVKPTTINGKGETVIQARD